MLKLMFLLKLLGTGVIEGRFPTTYTYNTHGDLITESIDNNSDGVTDSVITYGVISSTYDGFLEYISTYNARGNLITVNLNGILVSNYTYYANGNLRSEVSYYPN